METIVAASKRRLKDHRKYSLFAFSVVGRCWMVVSRTQAGPNTALVAVRMLLLVCKAEDCLQSMYSKSGT